MSKKKKKINVTKVIQKGTGERKSRRKRRKGGKEQKRAICSLEVWKCARNTQGRPQIEQVKEAYLRWSTARQGEAHELW